MEDIKKRYTEPDPRIKWAREYNKTMLLHVHGVGLSAALEQVNHYENKLQKEARDLFAYSNKHVTARLLSPAKNVFSAKGGTFDYKTTAPDQKDEIREKLSNVYNGYSLSRYMGSIAFDKFISDPNGLFQVIQDNEGYHLEYTSINVIRNYEQAGIYVNWVVFEPYETGTYGTDGTMYPFQNESNVKASKKYERFRAIDKNFVYEYLVKDKEFIQVGANPHNQNRVPAILCSDIENPLNGWKISFIDNQIELLKKVMDDNSIINIVEKFHNFPQKWEIVPDCPTCMGTGVVQNTRKSDGILGDEITCPTCKGSGDRHRPDVTDVIRIKQAMDGQQQLKDPTGYVVLPTEAWDLMVKSIDRTTDTLIQTRWGSSMEYGQSEGSQYATATGRWIDVQPVQNNLSELSDSIEFIHSELAKLLGKSYMPTTFEKAEIHYGRNYLLETTSQLLKTYNEINQYGENIWMSDIVSTKWLETEYKDNETMLAYHRRLSALDAMPHNSLDEVFKLGNQDAVNRKLYFNDYKNFKAVEEIIKMSVSEVIEDYRLFINTKLQTK